MLLAPYPSDAIMASYAILRPLQQYPFLQKITIFLV